MQISQNIAAASSGYVNQRQQYQATTQRQRSLNSPGAPTGGRQNSFTGQVDSGFPGPPSPSQVPFSAGSVYNNSQQMRLQRQTSVPQATQHLPG